VIVSTGSGAVSMIDVTGGGSYRNRTVHADVRTGVRSSYVLGPADRSQKK